MPPRNENIRVKDILEAIARIKKYLNGMPAEVFFADEKTFDAVIRNFSVIGEAAAKLSARFRKKAPEVPWQKLIGMRNFVVHEYFGVSPQIVWTTAREDLPNLETQLQTLVAERITAKAEGKDKVHPWRLCPAGRHFVRVHSRAVPPSRTNPEGGDTTVTDHCADNPSHKDIIRSEELGEIARRHFGSLAGSPCPDSLGYSHGNDFDSFIRGWTQYWNEVLSPDDPLDPNLVKALIATESAFNPDAIVKAGKKEGNARGLMQVTDQSQHILANERGEMKDHLVDVPQKDMTDPSLNIAAGIRWLFRKREIAKGRANKKISWTDVISKYKAYPSDHPQIKKLNKLYQRLSDCNVT